LPEDPYKVEMLDKKEGEAYYRSTVSYLKDLGPDVFGIHNFSDFRKVKQCILHNIPSRVWGSTPQTHYLNSKTFKYSH